MPSAPHMIRPNKMGTDAIPRLLISMSLPMMVSMVVQALYNVVDSMVVAQRGEKALTAVSLSYPAMSLMIAFGVGTGIGVNATLSRNLGAENFDRANDIGRHAMLLPLITSVIFAVGAVFLVPCYFRMQTTDPEIYEMGVTYLGIVSVAGIGMFYQTMCEKLLNSTGKTKLSMYVQLLGAIVNIILDPIMIFGLFGFPALGVTGAALATVIGQVLAATIGIYLNVRHNPEVNFSFKGFRFRGALVKDIYRVGAPSILMQSTGAFMTFLMNNILITFTATATAIFGIYFNLQSFVFLPVFGLNNGMVPIVSFNHGAGKKARINQTIKVAMGLAVGIMLVGFAIFQIFPRQLLGFFNANPGMYEIGIPAFRIISIHFIIAGICVIISSVCQALGYGHYSLIISVSRQIGILIPVAYVLGQFFGLGAVWWAYPIAEVVALALSLYFLNRVRNREGLKQVVAVV